MKTKPNNMKTFIVLAALVAASSADFDYDIKLYSNDSTIFPSASLRPSDLHFKPNMTEFSISFFTFPKNDKPHFHFVYAMDDNNFIAFRSNSNQAQMALGEDVKDFEDGEYTSPDEWTSVVLTWTNVDGNAKIYINGVLKATIPEWQKGKVFPAVGENAKLTLGEAYKWEANPAALPLNTRISLFNIWNKELLQEDLDNGVFSCSYEDPGDIAKWEDSVWTMVNGGKIVKTDLNACEEALSGILESIIKIVTELISIIFSEDSIFDFFGFLNSDEAKDEDVEEGDISQRRSINVRREVEEILSTIDITRDVLDTVPPLRIKREVLGKIAPNLLERRNKQGIFPKRRNKQGIFPKRRNKQGIFPKLV